MDRIQGSLSSHDLTLTDISNYRRCGRSHKNGEPKPDTIFCSNFGKHAKLPEIQKLCLCGHRIKERCYLCSVDSNDVNDVGVVGNHCIKRRGLPNAIRDDPKKRIECAVCHCMIDKKSMKRHRETAKHKRDNDTVSTNSGDASSSSSSSSDYIVYYS